MKHIIAIFLCLILVLSFAGCSAKKNNLDQSITFSESSPTDNGVSIHLAEYDLNVDKPYLDIEWINASDKEQTFGMQFNIYKVDTGKLTSCATEDLYFNTIACALNPLGSHTERYYINAFDLSKDGTYRFVVEDFPERELWIDFKIKNTAVSKVGGVDSSNVKVTIQ